MCDRRTRSFHRCPAVLLGLRRMPSVGLFALALWPSPLPAAEKSKPIAVEELVSLPAGIYLPVALYHSLKAGSSQPGTPVEAFTTQRVPVARERYLPRGTAIFGTLLRSGTSDTVSAISSPANAISGASGPRARATTLILRFTSLRYRNHDFPLQANALAIANFTDVADTSAPLSAIADPSDSSPANWTTRQIGGDVLTRSNWIGTLDNTRMQRVGFADFHGVYADPPAEPALTTPQAAPITTPTTAPNAALPRALGVFSSTAHGLYGFDFRATLTSPNGVITLTAPGRAELRSNDNLLLQVF